MRIRQSKIDKPGLPNFDVDVNLATDQRQQTTTTATATSMTPRKKVKQKISLMLFIFITSNIAIALLFFFGGFTFTALSSKNAPKTLDAYEHEKAVDMRKILSSTGDKKWHLGKTSCVLDANYASDEEWLFNSEEDCCEWFPEACDKNVPGPGLWYLTEVEGKPTCVFGASDDPSWAEETYLFPTKRECCIEFSLMSTIEACRLNNDAITMETM